MTAPNTLSADAAAWLDRRGISPEIAVSYDLSSEANAPRVLRIPYIENGKPVDAKFRNLAPKDDADLKWWRQKDGEVTFWNVDVLDHPDIGNHLVVITEGELDALSVIAAGYEWVMSLPFGAIQAAEDEESDLDPAEDDGKFAMIWRLREKLKRAKGFIIATDGDEPGKHTASALARRLRPERCWTIRYPNDEKMGKRFKKPTKDLNDVLRRYGAAEVIRTIHSAKQYPVQGLYRLSDFPDEAQREGFPMFHPDVTAFMRLVLGAFYVMTGFPSAGKSTLLYAMVAHMIRPRDKGGLGLVVCIGSFETRIKPTFQSGVRAALLGCTRNESYSHPERDWADDLMERNLLIIRDRSRKGMSVDRVLEAAEIAVVRDGAQVLILDPWNEIDHETNHGENETQYANRVIRTIKAFADDFDCATFLVAHPAKPQGNQRGSGGKLMRPDLYSISGSAAYYNKADYGLVAHRPDMTKNLLELWVAKVRDGFPGKHGVVKLDYDLTRSAYNTYYDQAAMNPPMQHEAQWVPPSAEDIQNADVDIPL